MNSMMDLAGVGAAIVISIALAVGLEWVSLRCMMLLMPGKPAPAVVVREASAQRTQRQKAA